MIDQLISFETAKLAKEKGFTPNSVICATVYNKSRNILSYYPSECFDGKRELDDVIHYLPSLDWITIEKEILAPTQSLLQKWLREKHNIHIVIRPCMEFFYEIYNSQLGNPASELKIAQWSPDDRNTYEESLELALYEALKFIK